MLDKGFLMADKGKDVLMKKALTHELYLSNDTHNLSKARDFLRVCIVESGKVPKIWQNKITLAVDEAVSNIIEHAYEEDEQGCIHLQVEISTMFFKILIVDSGKSFSPTAMPELNLKEHVNQQRRGGLGLFIMRRIMDEVKYSFVEGKENELRMIKYFDENCVT